MSRSLRLTTACAAMITVAVSAGCATGDTIDTVMAEAPPSTIAPAGSSSAAAPEPGPVAPAVMTSARVDHALSQAAVESSAVSTLVLTAATPTEGSPTPSDDHVAELIAGLTRLEEALDADAIRELGDDPVLEAIAGPVEALDLSALRVIDLLTDPTGPSDYVAALSEAARAIRAWEGAVPEMEAAWEDAVARWTAAWEQAAVDWETAWEQAAAEWRAAWEQAVTEWEAAWAEAAVEWEAAWADAAVEWEAAWAEAATEWEAAWAEAATEWEAAWEEAIERGAADATTD